MTANINNNKEKRFSKILLAIDGSNSSIYAADYAIDIAKQNDSQLTVLYVIDFYKYPYFLSSTILSPSFGSQKYSEEKKKAEEWVNIVKEKFIQSDNNKNIKTEIIEGTMSVAATIVDYAESLKADLIIVGSRGRTGFKRLLIGSVALDVVKYAHCPVLVIR